MAVVEVAEQQGDRDRLGRARLDLVDDPPGLRARETGDDRAVAPEPLTDLEPVVPVNEI